MLINQFYVRKIMVRDTLQHFYDQDLLAAVKYGQIRTEASRGLKDNWGLKNNNKIFDARRQTIGTLGEWAVASYFEVPYEFTVNTFKAPDVVVHGVGLQVKASERADNLIIRPDAKNDEPYILVHVSIPEGDPRKWTGGIGLCYIVGWLLPWQARLMADLNESLWRDPGNRNSPAIFIPSAELKYMEDLEKYIEMEENVGSHNER